MITKRTEVNSQLSVEIELEADLAGQLTNLSHAAQLQKNPPTIDFTQVKEIRDLSVGWISSVGANIEGAATYERKCKRAGIEVDPIKLTEILGGERVHYRLTTLNNGLRFVGIYRDSDGMQIFDDSIYGGLISLEGSSLHERPILSTPDFTETDIGDGFNLLMTVSGTLNGFGATATYAEKKYIIDDTEVIIHYDVDPTSDKDSGHLFMVFESRKFKDHTAVGTGVEFISNGVTSKYTRIRFNGEANKNVSTDVQVAFNLADNDIYPEWDQVTFNFDQNGKMTNIKGISESEKLNPEWRDSALLQAIKKGQKTWFEYSAEDPEAKLISSAVLGKDVTSINHQAARSVNLIMDAALNNQRLTLANALGFTE